MKGFIAILAGLMLATAAGNATAPPTAAILPLDVEVPRSRRRLARFFAWVHARAAMLRLGRAPVSVRLAVAAAMLGASGILMAMGLPPVFLVGMAYGVHDASITANDLVKKFAPEMVQRLEARDVFGQFFKEDLKPPGVEKTVNYIIDATANEADRQAPGSHRVSKQREAYEVEVHIKEKVREPYQITWEMIRKNRLNEPQIAVRAVADALARSRVREEGRWLFTQAAFNAGTPTDPAAAATGETPHWWNSTDTFVPPAYGENTFATGHDHVETGAADPLTPDRIRTKVGLVTEHGYGDGGIAGLIHSAEERAILNLANVIQQNQQIAQDLRQQWQKVGRLSAANGYLGVTWIQSDWVPKGVVGVWDSGLGGLPQGGAVRVVEVAPSYDTEDDKDTQSTWFEGWMQDGYGILHKGAGCVAHVA